MCPDYSRAWRVKTGSDNRQMQAAQSPGRVLCGLPSEGFSALKYSERGKKSASILNTAGY